MRVSPRILLPTLFLTVLAASCGKEVCQKDELAAWEVAVTFTGFDKSAASVLEFDSQVVADPPAGSEFDKYETRRIGRIAFPNYARDGATFVFEPGNYLRMRANPSADYKFLLWLRVYDDQGRLLAEGKFRQESTAGKCHLNGSMTVSGDQSCADKVEGDPCPIHSGNARVCMGAASGDGTSLQCQDSSCGDGYVDRLNGELCEDGVGSGAGLQCSANCLPLPVQLDLTQPGVSFLEVLEAGAPPAREYTAGAVRTDAGELILFGGRGEEDIVLGDTWRFDGSTWAPIATGGTAPAARQRHSMVYYPPTDQVVLFGGSSDGGDEPTTWLDDLWTWDATDGWQQHTAVGADVPPGTYSAPMVYDPDLHLIYMHGGSTASGTSAKTWVLRYTTGQWTWEDQSPANPTTNGPGSVFGHTFVWMPGPGAVLLGGQLSWDGTIRQSLWQFVAGTTGNPGTWTKLADNLKDDPRVLQNTTRHVFVPVPDTSTAVIFGGTTGPKEESGLSRLTWVWDAASWQSGGSTQRLQPTNVPTSMSGQLGFALPGDGAYVFGGRVVDPSDEMATFLSNRTWVYRPDADAAHTMGLPRIWMRNADETTTPGFYGLTSGDATAATRDRVGQLLVGDFDGDGRNEIAIGLPGSPEPGSDPVKRLGKVYIINTPLQGADKAVGTAENDTWMTLVGPDLTKSEDWGSWFGGAMAAGDINGDGVDDLVVGAPSRAEGGAIYLLFGGSTTDLSPMSRMPIEGRADEMQMESVGDADNHIMFKAEAREDSGALTDRFGAAVAVGDFDGDGLADVAVGAPLRGEPDPGTETGSVYVISGASNSHFPLGTVRQPVGDNPDVTVRILRSNTANQRLGAALAVGDINGDGYTDLVVGSAPEVEASCEPPACGAVAVLWGGPSFFGGDPLTLESLGAPEGTVVAAASDDPMVGMGARVTALDLDLDGHDDVVTSLERPDEVTGTPSGVVLFRGSTFEDDFDGGATAGTGTYLMLVDDGSTRTGFGLSLGRGDVNGDRRLDLLIGAPFTPTVRDDLSYPGQVGVPNAGSFHVLLSSRLATPWGAGSLVSLSELRALQATDDVQLPWLTVRGGFTNGFLGTAAMTSSHLTEFATSAPHAYTLVLEPGWYEPAQPDKRWRGQVYTMKLEDLLPCGAQSTCPQTSD